MWTKDRLSELIQSKLGDRLLIVVSNREPYVHFFDGDEIKCYVPPGGLVTALDPVMEASGGYWVAQASGEADNLVINGSNEVACPPENPKFTLKRVFLSKEEETGFYYNFANGGIWPLCHVAYVRPRFEQSDYRIYKEVQEKYADAVADIVGDRPAFVFIQDYHFANLAKMLKERIRNVVTAQFWHIPWPNSEVVRILPFKEELLDSLLYNDLLAFQTQYHLINFLDTVNRYLESRVEYDLSRVTRGRKTTLVRAFPIGIDFQYVSDMSSSAGIGNLRNELVKKYRLKDKIVAVGVDRIDYTKGIAERFHAVDRFLEKNPQYLGKFVLVQLGALSRMQIPEYRELNDSLNELLVSINQKYQFSGWKPIMMTRANHSKEEVTAWNGIANVAMVTSLHDGMNLVAKEFVAARNELQGALILSEFTGSARELPDALLVNPYYTDGLADAIKTAVEMSPDERQRRMSKMREVVGHQNVYRWAAKLLSEIFNFEFVEYGADAVNN
ncbi:MAG TPA: trehalose-6-phosphate synthase [Candidatus Acidoferrales bacterium]|nr:trehalose-6-phosphate synthase [Candidatus Acidoferrales bacterium]